MGDVTDFHLPWRPSTAQPPPKHVPGGKSVHSLVIADITPSTPTAHQDPKYRPARMLARLLRERRRFGRKKYGTYLQVEDPERDPTQDLLEELADAVCYAYRAKALGVEGADAIYEALLAVAGNASARWYWPKETKRPRKAA